MLNKLQLHVEREEIKWREELAAKDAELEELKASRLNTVSFYKIFLLVMVRSFSKGVSLAVCIQNVAGYSKKKINLRERTKKN